MAQKRAAEYSGLGPYGHGSHLRRVLDAETEGHGQGEYALGAADGFGGLCGYRVGKRHTYFNDVCAVFVQLTQCSKKAFPVREPCRDKGNTGNAALCTRSSRLSHRVKPSSFDSASQRVRGVGRPAKSFSRSASSCRNSGEGSTCGQADIIHCHPHESNSLMGITVKKERISLLTTVPEGGPSRPARNCPVGFAPDGSEETREHRGQR